MKITASEYEPKDIIKILREWSEKTQAEFGKVFLFEVIIVCELNKLS